MNFESGQSFSHYRLVEKIGEGGMGVVWKAFDSKLDRDVAIKILPETLARDPARLERFTREAKAVAALNHPNIVTIHNIEEAEVGSFLVMELIEGESLDKTIPRDGLPLSTVLDVAVPIATALAVAHEKGIVHRDVKPANIMVTPDGRVKVLDFGLAKLALELGSDGSDEQAATRTEPLTGAGAIVGTAPYMSPEQLHGQPVDRRSDIFSLGIVLYEMATGKRPFQGVSGIDLASSILRDTPPPVTDLRTELPRHLGRVIQQCLEKSPEQRFQTATDVRNQLEIVRRETTAESAPLVAPTPSPRSSPARWIGLAVAAILIVGLGGYGLFRVLSPARPEPVAAVAEAVSTPTILVLPFENLGAPEDEYFADGMTEEITSRLAGLEGLAVVSRTTAMQYKEGRPALREIGKELGVGYVLEGTVRWQRSASGPSQVRVTPQLIQVPEDTHLWAERYDRVLEDIFDVQSDIARQVSAALGLTLLESEQSLDLRPTENLEAYDFYLRGNDYLDRGLDLISDEEVEFAVQAYEEAVRLDPEFALAHARLARARVWFFGEDSPNRAEGHSDAATLLASAKEAVDRALEIDPDLPDAHLALGMIRFHGEGDVERALEEYRWVIEREPNIAEVYEEISQVEAYQGLWDEAQASMQKAVQLNPRLGRLSCWAGGIAFSRRDYGEALRHHSRAIRLTPDRSCPYYCKVWIYLARDGGTERAREVLAQLPPTLDLERTPALNHPWVRIDMIDGRFEEALERLGQGSSSVYEFGEFYLPKKLLVAQIYGLLDREGPRRESYEAARELLEARIRDWPSDDRAHSALGIAYAGLGRAEDAIREGLRGLELIGDSENLLLGYRLKDLAEIHVMVGEHDRAIDYLEQVLSKPSLFSAAYFEVDPTWKPLLGNPRFRALLDEYKPATG
jgi:serine/threonine protein kinase/tetratricopeptide (TPR) repeat protein